MLLSRFVKREIGAMRFKEILAPTESLILCVDLAVFTIIAYMFLKLRNFAKPLYRQL